jgi:hypothetical protein
VAPWLCYAGLQPCSNTHVLVTDLTLHVQVVWAAPHGGDALWFNRRRWSAQLDRHHVPVTSLCKDAVNWGQRLWRSVDRVVPIAVSYCSVSVPDAAHCWGVQRLRRNERVVSSAVSFLQDWRGGRPLSFLECHCHRARECNDSMWQQLMWFANMAKFRV